MCKVPETRAVSWGRSLGKWLALITTLGLMVAMGCSGDSTVPEATQVEGVETKEGSLSSERRDRSAEPPASTRSAQTVVPADISVKEIKVEPSEVEAGENSLGDRDSRQ